MKLKIQTATGSAIELNHFDAANWTDKITCYHGLTLAECRRELEDDIRAAQDCDTDFEQAYDKAIDDLRSTSDYDLISGYVITVEGRERGWRIVEDAGGVN